MVVVECGDGGCGVWWCGWWSVVMVVAVMRVMGCSGSVLWW